MNLIKHIITVVLASVCVTANAKDLGNWGNTWPITEKDIRMVIMENIADVNWEPVNAQLKSSAENFIKNLPKRELGTVDKTITKTLDLTVALPQDFVIPVLNENTDEYEYKVLYPKGTKINPIKYVDMTQNIVWFNAQDKEEAEFVKALARKYGGQLIFINVSGSMEDMMRELNMPIFFAEPAHLERFKITATPTLMYSLKSKFPEHILLTTFAKPFSLDEFEVYNGAEKAYLQFKQRVDADRELIKTKEKKNEHKK